MNEELLKVRTLFDMKMEVTFVDGRYGRSLVLIHVCVGNKPFLCLEKMCGNIRDFNRNLVDKRIIYRRENFVFLLDLKV